MKLNPDCIRDVMLEVEKLWTIELDDSDNIRIHHLNIESLYTSITRFDKENIFYAVFNLQQAGFLDISIHWSNNGIDYECAINYMTFDGHEFLNRIRDEENWKGIKKGLNAIRNYSLDAISAVSNGIASAGIAAFVKSLNL